MSIFQERQNRQYFILLSVSCAAMLLLTLLSGYTELMQSRDLVFLREGQIVSSLLDTGVSAEQIAAACSGTKVSEQGAALLEQMGHQEQTPVWLFSYLRAYAGSVCLPEILWHMLFCMLLLGSTVWYMVKKDRLYQEASELVEQFAEGDFSGHLPTGDQSGTVYRLFASIDQLARALKAGYESEHSSKEFLKDMISDLSHQIKTPLAALHMYVDIMEREPDHPDTIRLFTRRSGQSLLRMEGLIQSLLKIARLDAGHISFDKIYVPVRELVICGTEHLTMRAGQEGKQLQIEGDPMNSVCCDPVWTAEAVGNLVKNALDHTEEGGVIRIFWESTSAMIRLSVEDNGCGIAQEDIHHIFKRFYRSSHSSDRQGAGLGLPLARAIIEGQGGMLSVRSIPGEGTVFTISF